MNRGGSSNSGGSASVLLSNTRNSNRINVFGFGDSRTYLNHAALAYPQTYNFNNGAINQALSFLNGRYRWQVEFNAGVSGDTAQGGDTRKVTAVAAAKALRPADEIWHAVYRFGINDAINGGSLTPVAVNTFLTYAKSTLLYFSKQFEHTFVLSDVPYFLGYFDGTQTEDATLHATRIAALKGYNAGLKAYCDTLANVHFVDVYDIYSDGGGDTPTHCSDIHAGSYGGTLEGYPLGQSMKAIAGAFTDPAGVMISDNPSIIGGETLTTGFTVNNYYCIDNTGAVLSRDTEGNLIIELDGTSGGAKAFKIYNTANNSIPVKGGDILCGVMDIEIMEVVGQPVPPQLFMITSGGAYFAKANNNTGGYGKGCIPKGRQVYLTQDFEVNQTTGNLQYQPHLYCDAAVGTKLKLKIKKLGCLLVDRQAQPAAYGTRTLLGSLVKADFNSTADQAIAMENNGKKYQIDEIVVTNASVNLTTAAGGFYTAAAKGGTVLVSAAQVYTKCTATTKVQQLTMAAGATDNIYTQATQYLSLTTAQGAAAVADVYIYGKIIA